MTARTEGRSPWATIAILLCGSWLAAGALAKLLVGTPKELPEIVIAMTPVSLGLTFRAVIAIELVIVSLCLFRPRIAWPIVLLLFAFFDYVLTTQLAAGAESCGCFGSKIKVDPWLMLALDTGLALFLLFSRPWANLPHKAPPAVLLVLATLLSVSAPWIFVAEAGLPPSPSADAEGGAPQGGPRFFELTPGKWVGRSVFDVPELSTYVPEEALPVDGLILLWRQGCDHCAKHLRQIAQEDDGSRAILLLQLRDDLESSRAVDLIPDGPHVSQASFPEGVEWIVKTPWELVVEGGTIARALSPEALE